MKTNRKQYPDHAFPQHWSARELADAVPLRLSELIEFFAAPSPASNAAGTEHSPRWRHRDYLRSTPLPDFIRVR